MGVGSFVGSTIVEIEIGCGPAGELRYPSYQLDKWSFCGIGEFQSYSSPAMDQLQSAAAAVGHPEWGSSGGPTNAGEYNSVPADTDFFTSGKDNNYESDYGKFFLDWYTSSLINHGGYVMNAASNVFGDTGVELSMKVFIHALRQIFTLMLMMHANYVYCNATGSWYSLVVQRQFSRRRTNCWILEYTWSE